MERPELDADRYPFEGRSLTREEYIDAFLNWARWQRFAHLSRFDRLFDDEGRVRDELREEIAEAEKRRAIERVAAGESWGEIQRSIAAGRRWD